MVRETDQITIRSNFPSEFYFFFCLIYFRTEVTHDGLTNHMIPDSTLGRPRKYNWERLETEGAYVIGHNRDSLIRAAKSYFIPRGKHYTFTTRKFGKRFKIYRKP